MLLVTAIIWFPLLMVLLLIFFTGAWREVFDFIDELRDRRR